VRSELCQSNAPAIGASRASAFRFNLWLTVAIAVATLLRFYRLGTKSFWLDEAASVTLARLDWRSFWIAITHRQANMVLYYVLLRGWIKLGSGEFVVRSLSVAAGVAAILAIYLLGTRLFGAKAGRVAALLLMVHAFHVGYSQEARAYSWFVLLAIVSCLFFLLSLEQPSRKNSAAYILVSALMVYAQVFGVWMLLAQWISLVFRRGGIVWKQFIFGVATICLLISPLAYCLLFTSDRTQLYWLTKPTPQDFYRFAFDMTGNGGILLLVVYGALAMTGVGTGLRSSSTSADSWKYWFLLTWLILPVASALLVSLRWPVFEPRFLIFCLPPLVLLVSDAAARIRSNVLFVAALAILLGLSLSGTYAYYRARADAKHTDDWRSATRYVLSQARTGDAVLFSYSEERLAFDEYERQFGVIGSALREFPEQTDLELLTLRPSRPSPELLDEIVAAYKRVWVISAYQPNEHSLPTEMALKAHFGAREERRFGFVRAELFADKMSETAEQQGTSSR